MSLSINKLVLKNISFRYNGNQTDWIVHNFTMEIPAPSITTLLGLNGSGKTTLLMLLLGYFKPTIGQIFIEGSNGQYPIDQINGQVGYLPQRENIPFDYSVAEFILLGSNVHMGFFSTPGKEELDKIHEAMQFLGIEDLENRRLSSISGGELQRVRIARLLVQDPKIILMDEPSSHLDIKIKKQMLELIDQLKKWGKLIIYSTHEAVDALNFSDYSILMKKKNEIIYGRSSSIITAETLSDYFDTKMEISDIDGQKFVVVKNGIHA